MNDISIDLDLGVESRQEIDIVDVAKRINQHMQALKLKTKSSTYRAVRRRYTKQLEDVPLDTIKGSSAKVTLYELSENIAQFERIAQKRSLYVSKCLVRGWQTALQTLFRFTGLVLRHCDKRIGQTLVLGI